MTSKKRAVDGPGGPPALKRRKASAISTASGPPTAHPLRQTSFPPDDAAATPFGVRSPSAEVDTLSLVSGSHVSAAAPVKKKRGRKSKAEKAREQTPSVAGGRAPTAVSAASEGAAARVAKSVAGGTAVAGDEGEADEEGPTEVAATAEVRTKEQKEEEHRARGMLISAFSTDQFDRYENWRAANLSKASVRRLVNATISQSVPENVVIGMRAVAKVFIGDIIESARRVQGEWIEKSGEKQTDLPTPSASADPSQVAGGGGADGQGKKVEDDGRRGPMRPEHLREAVRRYRKGFEGGGVGMQWVWHQQHQSGVERFPTRTGGRRIFR